MMIKSSQKLKSVPISELNRLLKQHETISKAVLFGSWATQTARPTSDIDIALFGKHISDHELNLIRFELEEKIKTPLKFDVHHYESLSKKALKKDILKEGVIIYESKKS